SCPRDRLDDKLVRLSTDLSMLKPRSPATCISTIFERVMLLLSTLQSSARGVLKRKAFAHLSNRPCSISDLLGAVSSSRFRVHESAPPFFPSAPEDGFDKSCPSPGDLLPEADVGRAPTQH